MYSSEDYYHNDSDSDGDGDDDGTEHNNNHNDYGHNYNFDYFAFGLNRTHHLEITKERLQDMFDVILILERPDTQ